MLNDLLGGKRMASVSEARKLFFLNLPLQTPPLGKSPLPLAANAASLRVIVVAVVAELFLVV
jgi:hypothetical protein